MKANQEIIKKNILEVANQQIAENYPKLMPFIIRYNLNTIDEKNNSAIGSFSVLIKQQLLTIPIIYREGNVDATSYIGDDTNGNYYALTKLLYIKFINEAVNDLGKVVSNKSSDKEPPIDKGIIGSLFATPMTFSPKVAALNEFSTEAPTTLDKIASSLKMAPIKAQKGLPKADMIMDMAFKSPEFADSIIKKASENSELSKIIKATLDIAELKKYSNLTKIASYKKAPTVYFTMDQIRDLPKEKKQKAFQKIATEGFYIDNALDEKIVTNDLQKIAQTISNTIYSNLTEITNSGVWTAFTTDMNPINIIAARPLLARVKKPILFTKDLATIEGDSSINLLGIPFTNFDKKSFDIIFSNTKNAIQAHKDNKSYNLFIVIPNTEIVFTRADLIKTSEGYVNPVNGTLGATSFKRILITNNVSRIVNMQGTLYVPMDLAIFVPTARETSDVNNYLNTLNVQDLINKKLPIIKIASTSPDTFLLNKKVYSKRGVIIKLAQAGYKADSIKEIIKTAASSPATEQLLLGLNQQMAHLTQIAQQQTLAMSQISQILASLKKDFEDVKKLNQVTVAQQAQAQQQAQGQQAQLLQAISQMATEVGANPQELIAHAQSQGVSLEDLYSQLSNFIQQAQAQQQEAQPQQPQAQQAQAQQQEAQPQQPQAQQAQGQQQEAQAQQPQAQQAQAQGPATDTNGFMLDNISPQVLAVLEDLANKQVTQSAILSYLTDIDNPKSVVKQYSEKIQQGITGLVRILLIIELNYNDLVKNINVSKVSSFLNRGKSLAKRLTDFYINLENL